MHDDEQGVAVCDGRLEADARAQHASTSRKTSVSRWTPASRPAMTIMDGQRSRRPSTARPRCGAGHATGDYRRHPGDGPTRHLGDARRQGSRVSTSPRCAPPTRSKPSGRAGCASPRSRGCRARPPRAPRGAPTARRRPAPSRCSSGAVASWSSTRPTTPSTVPGASEAAVGCEGSRTRRDRRGSLRLRRRLARRGGRRHAQPVLRLWPRGLDRLLAPRANLHR